MVCTGSNTLPVALSLRTQPWKSVSSFRRRNLCTATKLHYKPSHMKIIAPAISNQNGSRTLVTTAATTDELLLNSPIDDLVKLPPHLLKGVIGGLRSKLQEVQDREDKFQQEMDNAHGRYLDLRLTSPAIPRLMSRYQWNALYHDLDSMWEPFPDRKSYEYDGWKAEHGDNAGLARRRYENGEHNLEEGEEHISQRWYAYQDELAKTWSYGTYDDMERIEKIAGNSFEQISKFRVHANRVAVQNNGNAVVIETGNSDFAILPYGLKWTEHISSQLLLYRLVVLFGMPPGGDQGERYKSAWGVILAHRGGKAVINFYDYKGSSSFAIYAKEQDLKDATDLLTHLISDRCLHSYDCTEAGDIA